MLSAILPKLGVFGLAALIGGGATFAASGVVGAKGPVSSAGEAPLD